MAIAGMLDPAAGRIRTKVVEDYVDRPVV